MTTVWPSGAAKATFGNEAAFELPIRTEPGGTNLEAWAIT
jgi:hypothetical protein